MSPPDNAPDPYPGYRRRRRLVDTPVLLIALLFFLLPTAVDTLLLDVPDALAVGSIVLGAILASIVVLVGAVDLIQHSPRVFGSRDGSIPPRSSS
jgi:hypothetical protein